MSHITDIKLRIADLDALAEAGALLGLELRRGQTTHRWYGRFMGDTTPPRGMKVADYGKCLHALGFANDTSSYEIGVIKALDGSAGFDLICDTWNQAKLLSAVGGGQMNRLRQEYAAAVAGRRVRSQLARKGFTLQRENLASGRIRLRAVRR